MCNRAFYVTIFDLFYQKGLNIPLFPNVERGFPKCLVLGPQEELLEEITFYIYYKY